MRTQDNSIASLLLRTYADADAGDDIVVPEPPAEDDVVEDDSDTDFFSNLITDNEVEDLEPSEPIAVDNDDEEEEEVVEVEEEPVAEVPVETPVAEPEPVVEQPVVVEEPVAEVPAPSFDEELDKYKGELQKQYAISDEDAEQILTDPQVVLPKLMANMHLAMLQQVASMMQSNMPQLVESTVKQTTARDTQLSKFKARYPELLTKENEKVATTALQTIKQLHPNITFDEMLDKVGPLANALMGKEAVAKPAPKPVAKPKPHIATRGTSTATPPVKPKGDAMSSFIDNLIG